MVMSEEMAKAIIQTADKTLEKFGFDCTFICGCHQNEDSTFSFPFAINFHKDLFVEFLYFFLNLEENIGLKEELFEKFNPVADDMRDLIKTVKL